MPNYELAEAAEEDLKSIALYTFSVWDSGQAVRYGTLLDAHFEAIGNGKARTRVFLPRRPELRVSRVEHHYVFHMEREKERIHILAVFHENMNLWPGFEIAWKSDEKAVNFTYSRFFIPCRKTTGSHFLRLGKYRVAFDY